MSSRSGPRHMSFAAVMELAKDMQKTLKIERTVIFADVKRNQDKYQVSSQRDQNIVKHLLNIVKHLLNIVKHL